MNRDNESSLLNHLDRRLTRASRILGDCAGLVRDLDLNRRENIRRTGEAIGKIAEIQKEIYQLRPDIMPSYMGRTPPSQVEFERIKEENRRGWRRKEATLEYLDARLRQATRLLDICATSIVDLKLGPEKGLRRIAEAMLEVFDIQNEIYKLRPDLMPDFLKEPPDPAMADEIRRQVYEMRPDLRPDQLNKPPDTE